MRQLMLIASVVGLLMYAGFATQAAGALPTVAVPATEKSLAALERGVAATGARPTRVTVAGWVELGRQNGTENVRKTLGWSEATPEGEVREIRLSKRDGAQYLSVRWEMPAGSAEGWLVRYAAVRKALAVGGADPLLTVQVEGELAGGQPQGMTAAALDALGAVERQDWAGQPAASSAGRSALLPPSAFGVNVQVAARQDAKSGSTRVWLAWPALQQEY